MNISIVTDIGLIDKYPGSLDSASTRKIFSYCTGDVRTIQVCSALQVRSLPFHLAADNSKRLG